MKKQLQDYKFKSKQFEELLSSRLSKDPRKEKSVRDQNIFLSWQREYRESRNKMK